MRSSARPMSFPTKSPGAPLIQLNSPDAPLIRSPASRPRLGTAVSPRLPRLLPLTCGAQRSSLTSGATESDMSLTQPGVDPALAPPSWPWARTLRPPPAPMRPHPPPPLVRSPYPQASAVPRAETLGPDPPSKARRSKKPASSAPSSRTLPSST
jgi:hypothetical protein